jgi:type IV secretory pathway VirB2 component (pilin)
MKKIKFLGSVLILIFLPKITFGAFCGYYGFGGSKTLLSDVDTSSLERGIPKLINNIIEFITECLLTPALIVIIIISGIYIMISLGNPARIEFGKRALLAAIIGLIVIFAAEGIVNIIR